jgi:hypothetical protein
MIERPITRTNTQLADWLITVLLFVGLSSLYYATASGITSSNDGSHYALLRTIVENRAFTLNQFDDYAEGNDIALVRAADGSTRLYSDRPPGTAVAAIPFYLLGNLLIELPATLPSRHDAANPRLAYVLMLPALAGAGTVAVLYWLLRHLALSPAATLTAVIFFALGTIHWKYSSVLYSHALSGFLVLLAVYLALRIAGHDRVSAMIYFLTGFILGWAVVVEYSNVLLVAVVTLYLAVSTWWAIRRRPLAAALPFLLGGLIPALFLAAYNTINFGRPWTLSYAFAVNYPWASELTTTFNFPLGQGLQALVVRGVGGGWCDGPCINQGFLLLSPVLLLAIPGFVPYFRAQRGVFLLTTFLFLLYLFLFSLHQTSHGFTADGRYLAPFLALLAIPMAYTLQWHFDRKPMTVWHALFAFLAYGLFFLSVRNILLHIGYSYNYTLDLDQLRPLAADPYNWLYLMRTLFPNWRNLPLLWLLELLLLALVVALIGMRPLYSWRSRNAH